MMRAIILTSMFLAAGRAQSGETLRDGDIIFHASRSAQSIAIQRATHSRYSHVGIVFLRGGKPFVFEAIASVRYTPLKTWRARGAGETYVVKRVKRGLSSGEVGKLRAAAKKFDGRPYDLYFEWSDERIYCSELVWKMYSRALGMEIGKRQHLREFDLKDPVVNAKLRERYGARIPLDEPVISPAALYDSPLLTTINVSP